MKLPRNFSATLALAIACSTASLAAKPSCCAELPAAEKNLSALPAKSLYNLDVAWAADSGQPFQLSSLRGHPVLLVMFFARCEYACPMLVHDLRKVREQLPENLRAATRIVLVTFDTERDTIDALQAYRVAQNLDSNWTLLRGSPADTQTLAMLLGIKFKREANGQFAHSNLITILDDRGEILHQRQGLSGGLEAVAEALTRATAQAPAATKP